MSRPPGLNSTYMWMKYVQQRAADEQTSLITLYCETQHSAQGFNVCELLSVGDVTKFYIRA